MSTSQNTTLLEQIKIQARALVPVIKAFEIELGSEKARAIANESLKNQYRGVYSKYRENTPGDLIPIISEGFKAFAVDALEYDVVEQSADKLVINVTKCAYAEFYKKMGEQDLGYLLVCDIDNAMAEGMGDDLEFKRSQTIMQGAGYCDFCYRMRSK